MASVNFPYCLKLINLIKTTAVLFVLWGIEYHRWYFPSIKSFVGEICRRWQLISEIGFWWNVLKPWQPTAHLTSKSSIIVNSNWWTLLIDFEYCINFISSTLFMIYTGVISKLYINISSYKTKYTDSHLFIS
jgi:hypothetical protein